jgi:hypothetical protein
VATTRYYTDTQTNQVVRFAASYQAYTHAEFQALLKDCGFNNIAFYDTLDSQEVNEACRFIAIVAEKPG